VSDVPIPAEAPKRGGVDPLFAVDIKGTSNPQFRLQRQLERCNVLSTHMDITVFETAVRTALGDCPLHIKTRVLARGKEYNNIPDAEYKYEFCANARIGTPSNPSVSWHDKRYEPGPLQDRPGWEKMEEDLDYAVYSPRLVPRKEMTDYEGLLGIIKEELDNAGLGWKRDTRNIEITPETGIELPEGVAKKIEDAIVPLYLDYRAKNPGISYQEFAKSQLSRTPRTPLFEDDLDE